MCLQAETWNKGKNGHEFVTVFSGAFLLTKVIIYDNFFMCTGARMCNVVKGGMRMAKKNEDTRDAVVSQLKTLRREQGMTQEYLAELVGTKKSNISRLESGRYNPSLDFLIKVADGLGKQIIVKLR
jgi:DNA-binding XRE family transcriptional regulator